MHWRHFGFAAAAAFMLFGTNAAAQSGEPAGRLIAADPGISATSLAAAEPVRALPQPPKWISFSGTCGAPVDISETPPSNSGKFDVDGALRHAMQTGAPSLLVIVGDGIPDCLSVACSLSAEANKKHPAFRADVLAVGDGNENLRCIAENTNGRFKAAQADALASTVAEMLWSPVVTAASQAPDSPQAQADTAEKPDAPAAGQEKPSAPPDAEKGQSVPETAAAPSSSESPSAPPAPVWNGKPPLPRPRPVQKAEAASGQPTTPPSTPASAPKPFAWAKAKPGAPEGEPPPPAEQSGVKIRVLVGPKGPLIDTDLSFEVLAVSGDGTYRRIADSREISPTFALPEGSYVARIAHQEVVREFPFMISGTGVTHTAFSMDIGYVRLTARPTAKAYPLESGIAFELTRLGGGSAGVPVTEIRNAQSLVTLPEGRYVITALSGGIRVSRTIDVTAGTITAHDFNLRLGFLRLVVPSDAADIKLLVEAFSSAGPDSVQVLAEADGATALFRLQEGNYMAAAISHGRRIEMLATIKQGELTELRLPLTEQGQPQWRGKPEEQPRPEQPAGG